LCLNTRLLDIYDGGDLIRKNRYGFLSRGEQRPYIYAREQISHYARIVEHILFIFSIDVAAITTALTYFNPGCPKLVEQALNDIHWHAWHCGSAVICESNLLARNDSVKRRTEFRHRYDANTDTRTTFSSKIALRV
jgi:hypothetical protein